MELRQTRYRVPFRARLCRLPPITSLELRLPDEATLGSSFLHQVNIPADLLGRLVSLTWEADKRHGLPFLQVLQECRNLEDLTLDQCREEGAMSDLQQSNVPHLTLPRLKTMS